MGAMAAAQLRTRARALRQLAEATTMQSVRTLHHRAGPDTWAGPLATRFLDDLTGLRRELSAAHDELREAARTLDRRAAEIELLSQTPAGRR